MKWENREKSLALWYCSDRFMSEHKELPHRELELFTAEEGISPRRFASLMDASFSLGIDPDPDLFQEAYQWATLVAISEAVWLTG